PPHPPTTPTTPRLNPPPTTKPRRTQTQPHPATGRPGASALGPVRGWRGGWWGGVDITGVMGGGVIAFGLVRALYAGRCIGLLSRAVVGACIVTLRDAGVGVRRALPARFCAGLWRIVPRR